MLCESGPLPGNRNKMGEIPMERKTFLLKMYPDRKDAVLDQLHQLAPSTFNAHLDGRVEHVHLQ